jgi:dodecin
MAVQKSLDVIGEGPTVEEAVSEALDRVQMTLEGITSFRVQDISGILGDGDPIYRVEVRVWFTLLDKMHG